MTKRVPLLLAACLLSAAAVGVTLSQLAHAGDSATSAALSMTPLSPTASQWVPFHVRSVITNTDTVSANLRWELHSPPDAILVSADGASSYPPFGLPSYVYWTGILFPGQSHIITAHFQVGIPPVFPARPDIVLITSTLYDQGNGMATIAQETVTVTIDCCWAYLPLASR